MGHFLPFYPPPHSPTPTPPSHNSPKNQNLEKMKKALGHIIILHKCTQNHDHMLFCSWDMVHGRSMCFFIMGYILPFYSPNSLKNQNFTNMKKTPRYIIILHMCIKNYDQMIYRSWDIMHDRQTNRQTDRQTDRKIDI